MEELQDLNELALAAAERMRQYDGNDIELPTEFKRKVTKINNDKILYNKYSAIIETKGKQQGGLNIYIPNQWFYIAAFFIDFYNELIIYKSYALNIISKERLKEINGAGPLNNDEENRLNQLDLSEDSKKRLKRFITDYSWWGGAKTIDRGDFFVSPILSYANLVNVSQNYVTDLCEYLADKPDLVSLILKKESWKSKALENNQIIYFGSPGTGKSHTVNKWLTDNKIPEDHIYRTTFHPDYDYASFVGSYKPTMEGGVSVNNGYSIDELAQILKDRYDTATIKTQALHGFAYEFADYFNGRIKSFNKKDVVVKAGLTDDYAVEINKIVNLRAWLEEHNMVCTDNKITYEFVPQAFTNSYVKAWQNLDEDVYLIIEEINRGNCAQIFGDLFQLLDRKDDGYSEYPVNADTDLKKYLIDVLGIDSMGIKDGKLCLPPNLNIIATMNTSDQSLFPMDSAFKRRWEWKFIPNIAPQDGEKQITLHFNEDSDKQIKAGDYIYSWKAFLKAINERILKATRSEDKQLGFWFVKEDKQAKGISVSTFVSKVVFYLWNDVFKDIGPKEYNPFAFKKGDGYEIMSFSSFYELNPEGDIVENLGALYAFLNNINLTPTENLLQNDYHLDTSGSMTPENK